MQSEAPRRGQPSRAAVGQTWYLSTPSLEPQLNTHSSWVSSGRSHRGRGACSSPASSSWSRKAGCISVPKGLNARGHCGKVTQDLHGIPGVMHQSVSCQQQELADSRSGRAVPGSLPTSTVFGMCGKD